MAIPEDWIQQQVFVQIVGGNPDTIHGELLEVNDRGVVLSVPLNQGSSSDTKVFYHWPSIRWLGITSDDDQPQSAVVDETYEGRITSYHR